MLTLSSNVEGTVRLGIDMTPLGRRAGALQISVGTLLADINDGMGVMDVEAGSGDDIEITLRNGTRLPVSFDGDLTLGDVIATLTVPRQA